MSTRKDRQSDAVEREGPGRQRRDRMRAVEDEAYQPPPASPKAGLGSVSEERPEGLLLSLGGSDVATPKVPKLKLALGSGDGGGVGIALPAAVAGSPPLGSQEGLPEGGLSDANWPDVNGDGAGLSSQMFMQEVAILQMQAEGWKAEWSIAMQENERLRMALVDAQSALEALPPAAAEAAATAEMNPPDEGELQWRDLCSSIARAADEEKAALLEEVRLDAMRCLYAK